MRTLLAMLCSLTLAACGGLENEPLTLGVIRGSLLGAGPTSSVFIFNQPEFTSAIDAEGRFELQRVPRGEVELLVIIDAELSERVPVEVVGGAVADVGVRAGRPAGLLKVELKAPAFQRVDKGTASIEGTALVGKHAEPGEWVFSLPAGCYQVHGTAPGLGTQHAEACVEERELHEVHLEFAPPDGSPGREGCRVSGCAYDLSCHSDGSCGL